SQVFVDGTVKLVAARFGGYIDHAACVAAVFRAVVICLHAEFGDSVGAGDEGDDVAVSIVYRYAVEKSGALIRGPSADLVVAGREYVLARQVPVGCTLGYNPGNEIDEVKNVAPVQGNLLHSPSADNLAQAGVLGLNERRLARDFDRLSNVSYFHGYVDTHGCLDIHDNLIAHIAAESGSFDLQSVIAGNQVYNAVSGVGARRPRAPFAGVRICQGDRGFRHSR